MLSIQEYSQASFGAQLDYLHSRGCCLLRKETESFHVVLYSVDTFFAESWQAKDSESIYSIIPLSANLVATLYCPQLSLARVQD